MKKVLAIMGSPRKNKNTDLLLDQVIKGISIHKPQIDKIYLRDLNISPCISCGYCEKTGECSIKDDMQELYKKFDDSDVIIIASPLYFNTVSSLVKIMIDRCQVFWANKYIIRNPSIYTKKKRKGLFICTAGSPYRENQFDACVPVMDLFFKAINTSYTDNIFVSNTDKVFINKREDVLNKSYEIGRNLL